MEFKKEGEKEILCRIDNDDLWENGLEFTDLVNGGEKAKEFLTEVVRQAREEIGVNMENMPLMVKAVPISKEEVELHISGLELDKEKNFMNRIEKLMSGLSAAKQQVEEMKDSSVLHISTDIHFLQFQSLEQVEQYAKRISPEFTLYSSLYKDKNNYYLILYNEVMSPKDFQRLKIISSDYGTALKGEKATIAYYEEHYEKLIQSEAITRLAEV